MENVKKFDWIALYNFGKDKLYCCLDNGLYECIPIRSEHAYNKSGGYVYVQTCMGEQRVSPRRIYATPEDACKEKPYNLQVLKMDELFKDWDWDCFGRLEGGYYIKDAEVKYMFIYVSSM